MRTHASVYRQLMLDEAVRESMSLRTMKMVIDRDDFAKSVKMRCKPKEFVAHDSVDEMIKDHEARYAHPGWWQEDVSFYRYPARLRAIRARFKELCNA